MNKLPIILTIVFLLVFIAGGATGLSISKTNKNRPRHSQYLARELGLSEQQNLQMQQIWQETMREAREAHRQRHEQLRDARNEAIFNMLSPEQTLRFEQIQNEYKQGNEELSAIRKQIIDDAVVKTKAILSPEQAEQYDKLRPKDFPRRSRFGDHDSTKRSTDN